MQVSEAVLSRKSIRSFLKQSIPNLLTKELLARASNYSIAKNENIYLHK